MENSQLERWRARLSRASCWVAGILCLFIVMLHRGALGEWPSSWPVLVSAGVALLMLAIPTHVPTIWRSLPPLAVLSAAVFGWTHDYGWAPGIVIASCVLVVQVGLVAGRVAVLGLLLAQSGFFVWGGFQRAPHVDSALLAALDPRTFDNWLRAAVVFIVLTALLFVLMREAESIVGGQFARARRSHKLAALRFENSRLSRLARLEAESQLREPQKIQAIAQLSGGLAHLLNNALTVVRSSLDDLEGDRSLAVRANASEAIGEAVVRVSHAVRGLITVGRNESVTPRRLDLLAQVHAIVDGLRPTLPETCQVDVRGVAGQWVRLEPSRLRQLIVNLLLNATDAVRGSGRVQLSVRPSATFASSAPGSQATTDSPERPRHQAQRATVAELIIEDDGAGMDPETLVRARDAFFSSKNPQKHVGLGLTMAEGIAHQASGELDIVSEAGLGTRVTVRLPLEEPLPAPGDVVLMHDPELGVGNQTNPGPVPTETPSTEDEDEDEVDPQAWKLQVTRRMAQFGMLVALAVSTVRAVTGHYRSSDWAAPVLATVGLALAGFLPRAGLGTRLALLAAAPCVATWMMLVQRSYLQPSILAGMALLVAWLALLGPRWAAPVHIVLSACVMLVAGRLHELRIVNVDLSRVALDEPNNWFRIAGTLPLVELALALSVLSILQHARRATLTAEAAERRVSRALEEEDRETEKLLSLERDVARSERMEATGRAFGNVAHDLNNALQRIVGPASELECEELSDAELARVIADLWEGYEHARALSSQFIVTDAAPLHVDAIDLGRSLQRSTSALQTLLDDRITLGIDVQVDCFVRILELDFQRLLYNLVTNARDAIEREGHIHVSVSRAGGCVSLEVDDDGQGMDDTTRVRIFEPFFTTKPSDQGTGLGLHSVAQVLERSSGTPHVSSKLGAGTRFEVSWPLAEAGSWKTPTPSATLSRALATGTGTILVVEDEPQVRSLIVRTLRRAGYSVIEAADGDAALELVASTTVHCRALCVDGVIPGASSADVIDAFAGRYPESPVLLISGHLPSHLEDRGLLAQNATLLPKPFEPERLCQLLAQRLSVEGAA